MSCRFGKKFPKAKCRQGKEGEKAEDAYLGWTVEGLAVAFSCYPEGCGKPLNSLKQGKEGRIDFSSGVE